VELEAAEAVVEVAAEANKKMDKKIKLIIPFLLLLTIIQFTSAYSVTFITDKSGWDYEQYYCGYSQSSCNSPSYVLGGYESSNSHTFNYDYLNYNAAWMFEECHRPQAWWWYGYNPGPFYPIFDKKTYCASTFNSLTISDSNPFIGDTIQIYPNINSAFTISDDHPDTPKYWPSSHNDWYTSDITVSAVVKDPTSAIVMTLASQVASIYQDESQLLTFNIDTSSFTMPGTYTVEVKTQASDCICDQTNDIIKNQTVYFTLNIPECLDDSDCDDGLWCNGEETCNLFMHTCETGTPINCSSYDISPIGICFNNPDNNPFTWDYRLEFLSVCNEYLNECTQGDNTITHTCDKTQCSAECEEDSDCTEYPDGTCLSDCICSYPPQPICGNGIVESGEDCEYPNTVLASCDLFGETYLQDYCDAECHYADDWCETQWVGCTADVECDEIEPGTNGCNMQCEYTETPECSDNSDCDYLDNDYCEWDEVIHDEGICVDNFCEVYTTVFDCNDWNNEYCCGTEIWFDDFTCENAACVFDEAIFIDDCDNGLYCDGQETCSNAECFDGTPIDCSFYNIFPIATCFNNPDNNPFTWDYFIGFTSICDEDLDECTTLIDWVITHTCNILDCGAECEEDSDCTEYCNGVCLSNCMCSYPFQPICGNGLIEGNEVCDDGVNNGEYGYCNEDCTGLGPYCGDGFLDDLFEECDDGNLINWDGCSDICEIENGAVCGNGILEGDEECDDGNLNNDDGCSDICEIENGAVCGNGILEGDEECDDGNLINGDGCSDVCVIEEDDDDDDDDDDKCKPKWECSSWSDCINDIQTRNCIDLNRCKTNYNKPAEIKECGDSLLGGLFNNSIISLGGVMQDTKRLNSVVSVLPWILGIGIFIIFVLLILASLFRGD